jgi:hypothetical protein
MSRADPLAEPKAIGEDVEAIVVDAVDGLQAAADPEAFYDAAAVAVIGPRTAPDVTFGSISLVEAGTRVEIKACKRRVSNGARGDRPGRWTLQVDQHEQLVADSAVYLLAVYEEVGATKELDAMLVVPASIVDTLLVERWYDVDRHEGQIAQVSWPTVLGREVDDV